ncbi:MAG: hypothetical protein ACPG4T_17625 [Nannocystaceae bacterium]
MKKDKYPFVLALFLALGCRLSEPREAPAQEPVASSSKKPPLARPQPPPEPTPSPNSTPPPKPTPPPEPPPEPTPQPPQPTALFQAEADLDGDGKREQVTLFDNGKLQAAMGDKVIEGLADLDELDLESRRDETHLRGARFDKTTEALVLEMPTPDDEDPPTQYQVFVLRNQKLVRVFAQVVGVFNAQPLLIAGNGTVGYREDGWTACERVAGNGEMPERARIHVVTLSPDSDGMLTIESRKRTRDIQNCADLGACPFVYFGSKAQGEPVGEILRFQAGTRNHRSQALSLGVVDRPGTIELTISEEKPEVTHLDAVSLVVAGVTYLPTACRLDPSPLYCQEDGRSFRLVRGETLTLTFEAATSGAASLVGVGHYNPVATDH